MQLSVISTLFPVALYKCRGHESFSWSQCWFHDSDVAIDATGNGQDSHKDLVDRKMCRLVTGDAIFQVQESQRAINVLLVRKMIKQKCWPYADYKSK